MCGRSEEKNNNEALCSVEGSEVDRAVRGNDGLTFHYYLDGKESTGNELSLLCWLPSCSCVISGNDLCFWDEGGSRAT